MSDRFVHVLFQSTHHALWAEQVLQQAGIAARVVSVPRELSSDCGYCVRVARPAADDARVALQVAGVEFDRFVD
ncbi:MAG: DUF3343 domain-containing protein [Candidatus Krumholzibacteriia bacterium]